MYGIIYKITNLINKKVYIGRTKQKLHTRWSGHKWYSKQKKQNMSISKAIKKYGVDNFTIEKIDEADNYENLLRLEEFYIKKYKSCNNKFGYNIESINNGNKYINKTTIEKSKKINQSKKRREISKKNGLKSRGIKISKNKKYVGSFILKNGNWVAIIGYNNININLGTYTTEEDAAKAYDIKAIELYGKNCILNFPEFREDYINGKITVNKNTLQDYSKSGERGIFFHKQSNRWRFVWFDKDLKRKKCKNFKTIEEAIKYRSIIDTFNQ